MVDMKEAVEDVKRDRAGLEGFGSKDEDRRCA